MRKIERICLNLFLQLTCWSRCGPLIFPGLAPTWEMVEWRECTTQSKTFFGFESAHLWPSKSIRPFLNNTLLIKDKSIKTSNNPLKIKKETAKVHLRIIEFHGPSSPVETTKWAFFTWDLGKLKELLSNEMKDLNLNCFGFSLVTFFRLRLTPACLFSASATNSTTSRINWDT